MTIDTENYVLTLSEELQDVFWEVNNLLYGLENSLSDDFQIVCELRDVFNKYTDIYNNIRQSVGKE